MKIEDFQRTMSWDGLIHGTEAMVKDGTRCKEGDVKEGDVKEGDMKGERVKNEMDLLVSFDDLYLTKSNIRSNASFLIEYGNKGFKIFDFNCKY